MPGVIITRAIPYGHGNRFSIFMRALARIGRVLKGQKLQALYNFFGTEG